MGQPRKKMGRTRKSKPQKAGGIESPEVNKKDNSVAFPGLPVDETGMCSHDKMVDAKYPNTMSTVNEPLGDIPVLPAQKKEVSTIDFVSILNAVRAKNRAYEDDQALQRFIRNNGLHRKVIIEILSRRIMTHDKQGFVTEYRIIYEK